MAQLLRGVPIQYEPKRPNRFVLEFPSELGIEVWKVQTTGRPKITINETEIPFINTSNWVAGRYIWEPVTFTMIDTIGPSTSQEAMEWVRLHAETVTGRMGYAAGYKKDLIIKQLDPTGLEIEKWVMEGCMITSAEFGENAMDDDSIQMVTVTVRPDKCILHY